MSLIPQRPLLALALLMALGAIAAPPEHHPPRHAPASGPKHLRQKPAQPMAPPMSMPGQHMQQHHPMASDAPAMTHFQMAQRQAAQNYYAQPEHQGFVPPGLARKGGLPPGQTKAWKRGQPLPAGVAWYALPRSLELVLGPPPASHRYVRVATDILLIAIGTGMVVDAMEDLAR